MSATATSEVKIIDKSWDSDDPDIKRGASNQYKIYEAATNGEYKRILARCGRKFGKTRTAARVVRRWAADRPDVYLVAAPTYRYLDDAIIPELRLCCPREILYGGSWDRAYNRSERNLRLGNGAKICLRSMEHPDAVRPLSVAGLVAEEFSFWSRYAWEECVRPTLIFKEAPALFIFTPKGMNQAYEEYQRCVDGDPGYVEFHFSSYDGPAPRSAIDAEAAGMSEGVRRQEIEAEFLDDLGGVFQGVRDCIAGVKEMPLAAESYVMGADVGEVNDFNVAVVVKRSTRAAVWCERFTKEEPETVAERFAELSRRYNGAPIWQDDTGLGWGVAGSLRRMGAPVKPYRFTAESKRRLVADLVMAISARNVKIPEEFQELITELNIYQATQTDRGNVQYGAPSGYHDDCVVALGLAVQGLGSGTSCSPPSCAGERTFRHGDA